MLVSPRRPFVPRTGKPRPAPEILAGGLGAADQRSDVYSLCAALLLLFQDQSENQANQAKEILGCGMAESPADRKPLEELDESFAQLLGESVPPPTAPHARFWSEEQVIRFRDHDYRIVTRLGSGGVGSTFKVIELDRSTQEDLGTYVAKVAHDKERGERVLRAYNLARSHLTRHPGLSAIYEVAREWRENDFIALLTWIEGVPLLDFSGVIALLADDLLEAGPEELAVRWLGELCRGLYTLHKNGLIHGDISPRNIIVSDGSVVLTDYDFVTKIGTPVIAPGTILYCSPSYQERLPANPSDDLYALAATFFHVIFERDPFLYGGDRAKERGLNWEGLNREEHPILTAFLDRATHPEVNQRFQCVAEAVEALHPKGASESSVEPREIREGEPGHYTAPCETVSLIPTAKLREERVEWLLSLLQSYPGSRWGNRETRGLDTPFAAKTYVDTGLEDALFKSIRDRGSQLVILCGNAGDGKTALLQRLAERLGFGKHQSTERVLQHRLKDGLTVRMNLDGSAASKGRSSDELLNEFLAPFQRGAPAENIAHLLAINDGRLLEWIESQDDTPLCQDLLCLASGAEGTRLVRTFASSASINVDGLAKSRKTPFLVIPAKAGIQQF